MIFNVVIPMVIDPAIGSFLISRYGIPTVINGEPGFIPTTSGYGSPQHHRPPGESAQSPN
jgi:hypothetical protein